MIVSLIRRAKQALYERYHPDYNAMICDVSYLMLIPGLFAFSKGLYGHAFWPLIVFITTQVRWRDPILWKDRVDRLAVACACLYHVVSAFSATTGLLHLICYAAGIGLFLLGVKFHALDQPFESHIAHAGLHILASIGNFVLYMGLTP